MGSIFPNRATLGLFLRPAPLERKAEAMTQPDMAATMNHHKKWRELRAEVTATIEKPDQEQCSLSSTFITKG